MPINLLLENKNMVSLSKKDSLSLSAKIALATFGEGKCIAAYNDYKHIHDTDALAIKYGVNVDFILSLVNAGEELQTTK